MSSKQKRFQLYGWRYAVLGASSIFLLVSCGSNIPLTITPTQSPTTTSSSPSPATPSSPSPTSTVNPQPADVKPNDKVSDRDAATASDRASTRIKQGRARSFTGTLNRASQSYFVENDHFTGDLDKLLASFGSKPNSENYNFALTLIDEKKAVQTIVVAKREGLKSYTGLAYAISSQSQESATKTIVCQSDRPTQEKPAAPELVNDEVKCPSGYTQLNSRRY